MKRDQESPNAPKSGSLLAMSCFDGPRVLIGDQVVEFPTRQASEALFSLALEPGNRLDVEVLGNRLWPEAPLSRLNASIATMTWQLRSSLEAERWRVVRSGRTLSLDVTNAAIDVVKLRSKAEKRLQSQVHNGEDLEKLAQGLSREFLGPWNDQEWVGAEIEKNDSLRRRLSEALRSASRN